MFARTSNVHMLQELAPGTRSCSSPACLIEIIGVKVLYIPGQVSVPPPLLPTQIAAVNVLEMFQRFQELFLDPAFRPPLCFALTPRMKPSKVAYFFTLLQKVVQHAILCEMEIFATGVFALLYLTVEYSKSLVAI